MSRPRVYFSNLSFETTENQLYERLQEYNVVSVLIPSQTVRGIKNKAVRPFGIAYAEFSNEDDATRVITELNGQLFMDRTLSLRMHIPIDSNKVQVVKRKKNKQNSNNGAAPVIIASSSNQGGIDVEEGAVAASAAENTVEAVTDATAATQPPPEIKPKSRKHRLNAFRRRAREEPAAPAAETDQANNVPAGANGNSTESAEVDPVTESCLGVEPVTQNSDAVANADSGESAEKPSSENVAFIGFIPRSTTDGELRAFFKALEPQEIVVFKNRMYRRGFTFHRHFTAALITFPDAEKLKDAKQLVSQEKFKGKQITVKNAYLDKIEEVQQALKKKTIAGEQIDTQPTPDSAPAEAPALTNGSVEATASDATNVEAMQHADADPVQPETQLAEPIAEPIEQAA